MTRILLNLQQHFKMLLELLKLSLTSAEFYKKLYSEFSGYGIYYLFTLSFIGSSLAAIILFSQISTIFTYFDNRVPTNRITADIESVLSNWEPFNYNGNTIEAEKTDPILINDIENKVFVAIDSTDQLKGSVKKEIPIIFGKSKLLINIIQEKSHSYLPITNDYPVIFGDSKKIIDSNELIRTIKTMEPFFNGAYIFIGFPLIVSVCFFFILLEKSLIVAVVYFALKTFVDPNAKMKSSIRLVAFSGGLAALFLPLTLIAPIFGRMADMSQLWTGFLIIQAITTMRSRGF